MKRIEDQKIDFSVWFADQDDRALNWINRISGIATPVLILMGIKMQWFSILFVVFYVCFWSLWGARQLFVLLAFRQSCEERHPQRINLFFSKNPLACWQPFLRKELLCAISDADAAQIQLEEDAERHIANVCFNPFYRDELRKTGYFLTLTDEEVSTVLAYFSIQELSERTITCIRTDKSRLRRTEWYQQIIGEDSFYNI